MPETNELLGLAIDKNPVDFADAFDKIMREKAMASLEAKRIELAQSVYGSEEDIDDEDIGDEDLDIDIDDLDLDDIDLDLEDLADLDNEGNTDEDA